MTQLNVSVESTLKTVPFSEIKVREVFRVVSSGDTLFMKIAKATSGGYNNVNLANGELHCCTDLAKCVVASSAQLGVTI